MAEQNKNNADIRRRQKNRNIRDRENSLVNRLYILGIGILVLVGFVGLVRVWWIMAVHGEDYATYATANYASLQTNDVRDKEIAANRGSIVDRNNQPLAVSNTVFNVILDVRLLAEQDQKVQDKTVEEAKKILGIEDAKAKEWLAKEKDGKLKNDTNYLIVKKKVEYSKGREIDELGYKWLYSEGDTQRTYTNSSLAAQVLGFVRGDGAWGIEDSYNAYMLGTPGRIFRTYEKDGSVTVNMQESVSGNTIVTTLDRNIQQFADDACKTAYNSYKCRYTSAVVMNPKTGEIYAMAQYPSFDSNDPTKLTDYESFPDLEKKFDTLSEKERSEYIYKAWKNFSLTEGFEPGSIYKPIVVAMALEEGLVTPSSTFVCNGAKTVPGWSKPIKCHKLSGHGTIDLQGVLAGSCNVGMMDIMEKMKPETYYKYHRDFGFHSKTGIDLPGEAAMNSDSVSYSLDELHTVEMATCSFGQGFNATAMQALMAFNTTINGGKLLKPYVVSQVVDAKGNVVKENTTSVVRQVISEETSDYLRKAMHAVVDSTGTARKGVIPGYAIGGKTGTAQIGDREKMIHTLSYISYLSVDDPEYVVMFVIDQAEGYYEGCDISPVPYAKNIMEKIISYKAIPPTGTVDNDVASNDANTVRLGDYKNRSLKDAISSVVGMGLDFEVVGSDKGDTVTIQYPEEGTAMSKGDKVMFSVEYKNNKTLETVPDLTGASVESAKEMLEKLGFQCVVYVPDRSEQDAVVSVRREDGAEGATEVTTQEAQEQATEAQQLKVVGQSPSANKMIEKGTIVQIKTN